MGVDDDKRDGWRDVLRSLFTGWQRPTTHPVDTRGEGAESLIGFVVAAALVGVLTGISAASLCGSPATTSRVPTATSVG